MFSDVLVRLGGVRKPVALVELAMASLCLSWLPNVHRMLRSCHVAMTPLCLLLNSVKGMAKSSGFARLTTPWTIAHLNTTSTNSLRPPLPLQAWTGGHGFSCGQFLENVQCQAAVWKVAEDPVDAEGGGELMPTETRAPCQSQMARESTSRIFPLRQVTTFSPSTTKNIAGSKLKAGPSWSTVLSTGPLMTACSQQVGSFALFHRCVRIDLSWPQSKAVSAEKASKIFQAVIWRLQALRNFMKLHDDPWHGKKLERP